jgi:site-specific DNA-methyltransferase (adenine-specific)
MNRIDPKFVDTILRCDCVSGMRRLPDCCVPLTVTSPPYDGFREYGGHAFDFEAVARELYRVTALGGAVVWVVQDQVVDGSFTGTKHRQAVFFRELGFGIHNELTVETLNSRIPQKTRYTPCSHTAFVLSKGRPLAVNLLRDEPNKQAGVYKPTWSRRTKEGLRETGTYGKKVAPFRLRSDVWLCLVGNNVTTTDGAKHPALMPESLAEDLVVSWSRPGDLVLDPLCGAATTCKMAMLNHRRYLGMEIHEPYVRIARARLASARTELRRRLDDRLDEHDREP